MYVSLIIPTYNKISRLKLVLASLEVQTMPVDHFEVILVDDASNDGTRTLVNSKEWPFELVYIRNDVNSGRSVARNTGISASRGKFIIFLDDDCLMCPDFIKRHYNQYKAGVVNHGAIWNLPFLKFFDDPEKGILRPEYCDRQVSNLAQMCITQKDVQLNFDKVARMSRKTKFEQEVEKCLQLDDSLLHWLAFTGGNVAVEKTALERVGGFDEKLGKEWGAEDIELGYRLYISGWKFQYIPEAFVCHQAHVRFNSDELSLKAIQYMKEKHNELRHVELFERFFNGTLNCRLLEESMKKHFGY